jgi:hypothetical protein
MIETKKELQTYYDHDIIKIQNYYIVTIVNGNYHSTYDYRAYDSFIGGIIKRYKLF